jgi:hypothetical protein
VQPRPPLETRGYAVQHWLDFEREDDVGLRSDVQAEEITGQHTDDGEWLPLDHERLPDRCLGIAKQAARSAITEHGNWPARTAAASIVGLAERSSGDRGQAEHSKEVSAAPDHFQRSDLAGVGQSHSIGRPDKRVVESLAITNRRPDRIRHRRVLAGAVRRERDQRAGIANRKRFQQQAVEDGKDGGASADAERQRQDGRNRQQRARPEGPNRIAEVMHGAATV